MKKIKTMLYTALLLSTSAVGAAYHVAGHIGKGQLSTPISQLAIGAGDTLCTLERNGTITIFNPDGSLASTLNTGLKNTDAIAVDQTGNFYIFSTRTQDKTVKVGARLRKVQVSIGVQCVVFTPSGEKIKTLILKI